MPTPPTSGESQPPPQANSSTTPVRKNSQGTERFATKSKLDAELLKVNMAEELAGQWVGPMPAKDFSSTFLPLPGDTLKTMPAFDPGFFAQLVKQAHESQMYNPFITIVASSNAMPGFKLINTSQHADRDAITGMKNKPDVSGYRNTVEIGDHPTKFEDMELIFEFKPPRAQADPFEDKPKAEASTTGNRSKFPFEPTGDERETLNEREKCRGQLACYARIWCARQHRTHCFVIWMGDPHARIIRLDRSGGVVSAKFNYRTEGDLLLEFLWRFSVSTDQARGIDTTVTKASPEETKVAKRELHEWKPSSERSVFKLQIPESDDRSKTRPVLVWGPLADPRSVTGRATRGYPAWDPQGNKGKGCIVFVKDSWRSCEAGMEKESAILKDLNAKKCRNVAKLICGDDLPGQFTVTKRFAEESWNIGGSPEDIVERVHTRFAEDVVGYHLSTFKSSRELLQAIYDAILAHKDAFEKCGILHRDISGGNILMRKGGGGILNDWDLAKRINKDVTARQPFRSGTWQFMSAALLLQPDKINSLQDDLESFFWLVLYHTLRYMKHNKLDSLKTVLECIFDEEHEGAPGQPICGGHGKTMLLGTSREPLRFDFAVDGNKPMTSFIKTMLTHWEMWYRHVGDVARMIGEVADLQEITQEEAAKQVPFDDSNLAMRDHTTMVLVFEAVLSHTAWPEGDEALDRLPKQAKRGLENIREHPKDEETSNGENAADSPSENKARKNKKSKLLDDDDYKPLRSRHGSSFNNHPPQTLFPTPETRVLKEALKEVYPSGALE